MKKGIIALICMILTLVFIIVGLVGTWYTMSINAEGTGTPFDGKTEGSITLTQSTGTSPVTGEVTKSHSDARKEAKDAGGDTAVYDVFDNTLYITIFALILAILAIIGILGLAFNFGKPKTMKMLGIVFTILTFVLALVATFYFMTAYPDKAGLKTIDIPPKDAGFWYSDTISEGGASASASYGPGYAWYLMLVGAILALISAIFVLMDKQQVAVATPPPQ